jgi:hypothetical protein
MGYFRILSLYRVSFLVHYCSAVIGVMASRMAIAAASTM